MEHLSISLWFTLIIWLSFTLVLIFITSKEENWTVDANILLYTIGLPAIAILLEYLLVR